MKRLICIFFSLSLSFTANADNAKAFQEIIANLESWGANPTLINAVLAHNAKSISLKHIKALDYKWRHGSNLDSTVLTLMNNPAAQELFKLERSMPYLTECFLMGDKGAIVAMTNKTSDYWQGDEEKFTESFKGDKGNIYISTLNFDDSSNSFLLQVSVPVTHENKIIGVITTGINVNNFENIKDKLKRHTKH